MKLTGVLMRFREDLKKILVREKLKGYVKFPIYAYIIGFALGVLLITLVVILKPDIPKEQITPEKFGLGTSMTWSYIIVNNIKVLITLFIPYITPLQGVINGIVTHNNTTLVVFIVLFIIILYIPYIVPLLLIGVNGFVHGLSLVASVQAAGAKGLGTFFILMVPHGIFELPALFLGAGAGIILSKELVSLMTIRWMDNSKLYEAFLLVSVAFFLFLVASVVETQFTFKLLKILQ